jgi:hypothetical protein
MKSKIDIIIETVKHYNSNNTARKAETDTCTYMNEGGAMCAVGRCLTNEGMQIFKAFEHNNVEVNTSVEYFTNVYGMDEFNNALKEEYRGHDVDFWKNLQYLHDATNNWNENGITKYGLGTVDSLFGEDAYVMVKKALAR